MIVGCCALMPFGHGTRAANPGPRATTAAAAVELPTFQAGLWEYRRSVLKGDAASPQVSMLTKCVDPSAEIRKKMAELKSRNCQFAPLSRHGDSYTSSWTCPTTDGAVRFRSVLTVTDPTSYVDMSETRSGQGVIQQKLEARRVGECPAPSVNAPASSAKPPPPATRK
jgi:hypothetical protein